MKTFVFQKKGIQIGITEKNLELAKKRLEFIAQSIKELVNTEPLVYDQLPQVGISFMNETYEPTVAELAEEFYKNNSSDNDV